MTTPDGPQQWAEQRRRVIVRDAKGTEQYRGEAQGYLPPAPAFLAVLVDGVDKYVASVDVALVEPEQSAPAEALDALVNIPGVGAQRAQQAIAALKRAGFDIVARTPRGVKRT
jgi:hypothetical protein